MRQLTSRRSCDEHRAPFRFGRCSPEEHLAEAAASGCGLRIWPGRGIPIGAELRAAGCLLREAIRVAAIGLPLSSPARRPRAALSSAFAPWRSARARARSTAAWNFGVKSQGNAASVIANRVYLGEARSGKYVKEGAHPALVDEATWSRANRRKAGRSATYGTREGGMLSGQVLRCGSCLHALTYDASMAKEGYRCKALACSAKASVQASTIEPAVLEIARGWHAVHSPDYLLSRAVEDAMIPALEDRLTKAEAEQAQVEADHEAGALSPSA